MKKACLIFVLLFCLCPAPPANAQESTERFIEEIYQTTELYRLEEEAIDPMEEYFGTESVLESLKKIFAGENPFEMEHFFQKLSMQIKSSFKGHINTVLSLFCLCIVSALIKNLFSSFMQSEIETVASLAIYCALIITLAGAFFKSCETALGYTGQLCTFMNVALPVVFTIILTNGGFTTVSAISPIMLLCVGALGNVINGLIVPGLSISFVVMTVDSVFSSIDISAFSKFLKSGCLYILGGMFVITVSLCCAGAITFSGVDSAMMKTTKYAMSSMIPVVGKFLSESAGTVLGLLGALSSSVGLIGTVALVALSAAPLIELGACALAFKLTGALAQPIADEKFAKIILKAAEYIALIFWCCVVVLLTFLMMVGMCAMISKWLVSPGG